MSVDAINLLARFPFVRFGGPYKADDAYGIVPQLLTPVPSYSSTWYVVTASHYVGVFSSQ
jgi:hypothetical protein